MGFIFAWGVIFAKKTKARKRENYPTRKFQRLQYTQSAPNFAASMHLFIIKYNCSAINNVNLNGLSPEIIWSANFPCGWMNLPRRWDKCIVHNVQFVTQYNSAISLTNMCSLQRHFDQFQTLWKGKKLFELTDVALGALRFTSGGHPVDEIQTDISKDRYMSTIFLRSAS